MGLRANQEDFSHFNSLRRMHTEHLPKPRMRDLQTELKIDTLDTPINIFLIFEKKLPFSLLLLFFFFTFEIVTLKFCLSNYSKHIFIFSYHLKKKKVL